MKKKQEWYLSPIKYSYCDERTLWQRCRFYVVGVIVATVLLSAFFVLWPRKAHAEGDAVTMTASWYSEASLKAEGTWKTSKGVMANGKKFDEEALTCAARRWPLGAVLRVTNIRTGSSVCVQVTDRIGKRFAETRVDLSRAAFGKIGNLRDGVLRVRVERVK